MVLVVGYGNMEGGDRVLYWEAYHGQRGHSWLHLEVLLVVAEGSGQLDRAVVQQDGSKT